MKLKPTPRPSAAQIPQAIQPYVDHLDAHPYALQPTRADRQHAGIGGVGALQDVDDRLADELADRQGRRSTPQIEAGHSLWRTMFLG